MTVDVIIAGGGVAGSAVAAALAEFGYRILLVEPGLDHSKRLAGEVIHPQGVTDLRELGLLNCVTESGAIPVHGFVVFAGDRTVTAADAVVSPSTGAYVLPYAAMGRQGQHGLAIEHGHLAEALLREVTTRSTVTVWRGARVSAIDLSQADRATVVITSAEGARQLGARLLVAADGRNSHLRRMAGITGRQIRISNMLGYTLTPGCLPHPGFGHVFAGGPAPALAYPIAPGTTRLMLDLPLQPAAIDTPGYLKAYVEAMPHTLRSDVERAIETQTPLRSTNSFIVPETVVKGRLVCAGDSGGCCHPLTATGLSACTRDAIRLRQALRDTAGDIPAALNRYASLREGPERTRLAGAGVVYEVFKGGSPATRLLRQGLFRYWRRSARGRAATVALLSTQEDRRSVLIREYIQVCGHSLPSLIRRGSDRGASQDTRSQAIVGLSRVMLAFLRATCFDSLPVSNH